MATRPVLALYRRYRPDAFADVIGQDHVVRPLTAALTKGRVNHAYLFSGPRGCGKTTSARVLARSLNCEQGPTPTPCEVCASCVDLASGGPGSLDVIEIDAASHRGIDDARDLRERVTFAPVRDRFKVVIIDEAHQITNEGFNALLKVVEEPPEHVIFVFATTEAEKVLGTIRSRTHHYPFRLVAPRQLTPYLQGLCEQEGVTVSPGALALVVRAGAGSVRDTLSVLDQLVAGAGPDGVDVDMAGDLLGYVPDGLLDDMVAALAAVDGAAAFGVVSRAVEGGHDPRRFAHDLLERLRTLVVVSRVGDAAPDVLPDQPPDAIERLRGQATHLGAGELSRAADTVAAALADMAGATPPRLLLELLVARLLVVGSEAQALTAARLDRLERQVALVVDGRPPAAPPPSSPQPSGSPPPSPPVESTSSAPSSPPAPPARPAPPTSPAPATDPAPPASTAAEPAAPPAAAASQPPPAGSPAGASSGVTIDAMRRSWDAVLDALREIKRLTWSLVSANAQVIGLDDTTLTLGFATSGLTDTFNGRGHGAVVREAVLRATGVDRTVTAVVDRRGQGADATPDPGPAAGDGPPPPVPDRGPVTRAHGRRPQPARPPDPDRGHAVDDPGDTVDGSRDADGAHGAVLVERVLGARVIAEETDRE